MKKTTLRHIACTLLCSLLPFTGEAQKAVRIEQPAYTFDRAQQMFNEGNYAGCIDLMTEYRKGATRTIDKAKADFLIAASSYAAKEPNALVLIENYLARHPKTPHSAEAQLLRGHCYFDRGDYDKALEIYQTIDLDKLAPEDQSDLLLHLGCTYIEQGETDKAAPCFAAIIEIGGPHQKAALYHDAHRRYLEGEYAGAESELTPIIDDKTFARPATALLAQCRFAQEKYPEAIETAGQYMERYPADSTYYEMERILGESYYRSGDNAQAIKYLSGYTTYCATPQRSSHYTLGMAYYQTGKYLEAIDQLGHVTTQNDALAQSAYLFIGQSYLRLNDPTNARLAFEMASRYDYDPQVQEAALYNYALTLHAATFSPFAESVTVFEKFLNLFPRSRHVDTINDYLVDVYMTTRNYESALNSINKIQHPTAKIYTAKQRILYRLGTERFANNDLKKAADYFTQAILLGNYDREAKADAYLWLAECLYREGNYAEAVKNDRLYLQTTATADPLAYYNLGYGYFKQHDFGEAQTQFAHYIKTETPNDAHLPRIADACTRLADCLYGQRRFADAGSAYDKAVALYPATGDYALFQKGFMAGLQKKYAEKTAIMQELRQRYPQSDYVDDAWLEEGLAHVVLQDGKAAACFTALLEKYPDQETARKAGVQLGMFYYNSQQPQKAIATYKSVIADYPGTEEAHIALQDLKAVYVAQNDVDTYAAYLKTLGGNVSTEISELDSLSFLTAERAFLKTPNAASATQLENYLKKYPKGAYTLPTHNYLGLYYYDKKAYDKARKKFQAVLKVPNNPYTEEALVRLADIQEKSKEYPEAYVSYQKLERIAKNKESRQNARLGMLRNAVQLGDNNAVIEVSARLLADPTLSPEHVATARSARAKSFIARGDSAQAAGEWEKLAEDPRTETGAQSAYLLAQYYHDKGDDTQAEAVVNQLLENGTSHQYWLARSFIVLADVYARRGDTFKARQYLLSLQNNYTADDDIKERVAVRLEKLETTNTDAQ